MEERGGQGRRLGSDRATGRYRHYRRQGLPRHRRRSRSAPIGTPPCDASQPRRKRIRQHPAASRFDADSHRGGGIGQVRNGLLAGGSRIRSLDPSRGIRRQRGRGIHLNGIFSWGDRGFESGSLQQQVQCEPRCFCISKRAPSWAPFNHIKVLLHTKLRLPAKRLRVVEVQSIHTASVSLWRGEHFRSTLPTDRRPHAPTFPGCSAFRSEPTHRGHWSGNPAWRRPAYTVLSARAVNRGLV